MCACVCTCTVTVQKMSSRPWFCERECINFHASLGWPAFVSNIIRTCAGRQGKTNTAPPPRLHFHPPALLLHLASFSFVNHPFSFSSIMARSIKTQISRRRLKCGLTEAALNLLRRKEKCRLNSISALFILKNNGQ